MNKEQKIMDAKIMQAKGERQKEIAKVLGVTERTVRI
jgi:DNA-binding NarL/FixJ family response regulator